MTAVTAANEIRPRLTTRHTAMNTTEGPFTKVASGGPFEHRIGNWSDASRSGAQTNGRRGSSAGPSDDARQNGAASTHHEGYPREVGDDGDDVREDRHVVDAGGGAGRLVENTGADPTPSAST